MLSPARCTTGESWRPVEEVLRSHLDQPYPHTTPPWRAVVLPLPSSSSASTSCFIAFSYSHTILDGPSGVAFHKSFLSALRSGADMPSSVTTITPPDVPFPPQFDTSSRLPISWTFLLAPLLAAVLPHFLSDLFGLHAHASPVNQGTWTGSPATFDPQTTRSGINLREIPAPLVDKALVASRANGARMTGTLHQLVTRALSKTIAAHPKMAAGINVTNFASQTAVNMRRAAGVPEGGMGEYASGIFLSHPVVDPSISAGPLSKEEWAAARSATEKFADAGSRLRDQPIGLLRYAPSIRKWTAAKVGQARDSSYEVSNIGVVGDKVEQEDDKNGVRIVNTVFAQPGMVVGCPICVNVASVKGGSLMYSVTWPRGALGVSLSQQEEQEIVDEICQSIRDDFERF